MKVIWLKPHHKFAYVKGDTCELAKDKAEVLIKGGFVKIHTEETPEPKAKETATAKTTKKVETATKK